jgi:hypothetical protein
MIQDAGWAGGQHPMVRPLSDGLRKRVVAAVASDEILSRSGIAVWGCGIVGGEVVAALCRGATSPQPEPDKFRLFANKAQTCAPSCWRGQTQASTVLAMQKPLSLQRQRLNGRRSPIVSRLGARFL